MMSSYKKIFISFLVFMYWVTGFSQTVTNYARKGVRVTFEINWDADNYGTIQWQRSVDNGITWTNIANATNEAYDFIANEDGLYRAKVSQEDCDPVYINRTLKIVDFAVNLVSAGSYSALFEISNFDFEDANIIEYGFVYNFSEMNTRNFRDMYRVKGNGPLPSGEVFRLICDGLAPATTYSIRVYFLTEDGSMIYGPGRIVRTLPGIRWTNEGWKVEQNSVSARFELPGFTSAMGNPNVVFRFGNDLDNLQQVNIRDLGNYRYISDPVENLVPNSVYLAQIEAMINGELHILNKEVKTLPDYSRVEVDETTNPVRYTIRWDNTQTLNRISPEGLNAEYARIIRVNNETLLCVYHGGSGNDHWQNIYLQRSNDNGRTWSLPTILMDKERSIMGERYWRFASPEMIKLQNGWILMSFTGNGRPETNDNCHVMVMISKDNGQTWKDPVIIGRGRTWEPQVIQLPNGELELFVSSEAAWWTGPGSYIHLLNQEILVSRSTDNGETWTEFERAAYSPERRDGMPVGIVMQGNKGILFAIETVNDRGYGSPSVLHRPLDGEWDKTPWDGVSDDKRWHVNLNGHGGAPYILQLPTGEIVITAHVNGRNGIWMTSYPRVTVGNSDGKNFTTPVTPLTNLPANQGAYYNSLFLKDNETVWLVVTHSLFDGTNRVKGEIKYLEGKIVRRFQ